jgi:hypothetical protein
MGRFGVLLWWWCRDVDMGEVYGAVEEMVIGYSGRAAAKLTA